MSTVRRSSQEAFLIGLFQELTHWLQITVMRFAANFSPALHYRSKLPQFPVISLQHSGWRCTTQAERYKRQWTKANCGRVNEPQLAKTLFNLYVVSSVTDYSLDEWNGKANTVLINDSEGLCVRSTDIKSLPVYKTGTWCKQWPFDIKCRNDVSNSRSCLKGLSHLPELYRTIKIKQRKPCCFHLTTKIKKTITYLHNFW